MKRRLVSIALSLTLTVAAAAQTGIRPILSAQWDAYFNNEERAGLTGTWLERNVFDINGVSIFPFTPGFSLESKVQFQATRWTPPNADGSMTLEELETSGNIGSDWWEVTLSVAPILIKAPFYFIVRPGIALGTGVETTDDALDRISPAYDLTIDANLETARVVANLTVAGSWLKPQQVWFVIPSAGASVWLSERVRLGGKLFVSYTSDYGNSTGSTNLAGLMTAELPIDETRNLTVGGTLGWTPATNAVKGSAFFGISFPAGDSVTMKYQVEPIIRRNAGLGLSNVIVMDARL